MSGGSSGFGAGTVLFSFSSPADPLCLLRNEWLLTNGYGGFAMGTALGIPTRRYHAHLIGATNPPVGRVVALHSCAERLTLDPGGPLERSHEMSSFQFGGEGGGIHPGGHRTFLSFDHDAESGLCRWSFRLDGVELVKELHLGRDPGLAWVRYALRSIDAGRGLPAVRLSVRPFTPLRDFHALERQQAVGDAYRVEPGARRVTVRRGEVGLTIEGDGVFDADGQWWHNFHYREEAARSQDAHEDLFSPGVFWVQSRGGGSSPAYLLTLRAQIDAGSSASRPLDMDSSMKRRRERIEALVSSAVPTGAAKDDAATIRMLTCAADAFVVSRRAVPPADSPLGSIIAGYPWFSDWGRDTFIAMPGLMLALGRFDEARRTLVAFAGLRRRGIIPNCFTDQSGEAEYNTVDASLWFIHAACAYAMRSGDFGTFKETLAPACADIVEHYRHGTDHGIAADPADHLIAAGTAATQLTWMDARRDGVTFTPRHGKPVEINALWFSALRELADALHASGADGASSASLRDLADAVGRSFERQFWNPDSECLFDCLTPMERSSGAWAAAREVRPNQIFAVCLPHSPLDERRQRSVVACVRSRLLTRWGVRTLATDDPRYRGRYEGSLFDRDAAYHNGTAWPWLLGPVAEAVMRCSGFSKPSRAEALEILRPTLERLRAPSPGDGTALGQIAEIYDGDDLPHGTARPGGCPAQAWSVGEVLRVYLMTLAQQKLGA